MVRKNTTYDLGTFMVLGLCSITNNSKISPARRQSGGGPYVVNDALRPATAMWHVPRKQARLVMRRKGLIGHHLCYDITIRESQHLKLS
jgi:hypothetical protein